MQSQQKKGSSIAAPSKQDGGKPPAKSKSSKDENQSKGIPTLTIDLSDCVDVDMVPESLYETSIVLGFSGENKIPKKIQDFVVSSVGNMHVIKRLILKKASIILTLHDTSGPFTGRIAYTGPELDKEPKPEFQNVKSAFQIIEKHITPVETLTDDSTGSVKRIWSHNLTSRPGKTSTGWDLGSFSVVLDKPLGSFHRIEAMKSVGNGQRKALIESNTRLTQRHILEVKFSRENGSMCFRTKLLPALSFFQVEKNGEDQSLVEKFLFPSESEAQSLHLRSSGAAMARPSRRPSLVSVTSEGSSSFEAVDCGSVVSAANDRLTKAVRDESTIQIPFPLGESSSNDAVIEAFFWISQMSEGTMNVSVENDKLKVETKKNEWIDTSATGLYKKLSFAGSRNYTPRQFFDEANNFYHKRVKGISLDINIQATVGVELATRI